MMPVVPAGRGAERRRRDGATASQWFGPSIALIALMVILAVVVAVVH